MKKSILLPLLLLVSGLFAQRNPVLNADKSAPAIDPSQLQGPIDTEPPTITCLNGLNANFNQTGLLTLWASDFLQNVDDNQTPVGQIKLGIRMTGLGQGFPLDDNGNPVLSLLYECSTSLGPQSIELWAMDQAGNTAYCEANLEINDSFGFCDPNSYDSVVVCVRTGCDGAPMPGLPVQIYSSPIFVPPFVALSDSVTDENGCATLHYLNSSTYTIAPVLDDDPLNGVTTYDLWLISKHILGIEPLDNPYKMIAADVNKSGSITSFDLVELKKLISGLYSELPNNTAWRFVDADFNFPNPANPFMAAFPEQISVDEEESVDSMAFIGIKIGDVDCTATLNAGGPIDYPDAFLAMPDTLLTAGLEYDIPLYMAETGPWQGYQFGLNINSQHVQVLGMTYHAETAAGNWNLQQLGQGKLTTSWWSLSGLPVTFGPDLPIVTFHVKALSNVLLKDEVSLDAQVLHAEGYAGMAGAKRDLLLTFLPAFKPGPTPSADKTDPSPDPTQLADTAPPTIECLNGLNLNILQNELTNIWASDILQYVHDNATPDNQIKIAIRKMGSGIGFPVDNMGNAQGSLLFDCTEVGTIVSVELWAMDLAGNTAFCICSVQVTDNFGYCSGGNGVQFHVCAKAACSDEMVQAVTFQLIGSSNFAPPFSYFDQSDASGCYVFHNNVPIASTYSVMAEKDDNPLNGVTSFDLLLMSKHIHGIQLFDEPWQWVAADVNRDGLVTLEDSVELSKLITGEYTELPNNTSWRFIPSGYTFPSPNPLAQALPDTISIANILSDFDTVFLSIKIGDVNCSAVPSFKPVGNPTANKTDPSLDPTQLGDFEPPTLVCAVNPAWVYVSSMQSATVWAGDLVQSIHDNATPTAQIQLSMRIAGSGSGFPLDAMGNPVFKLEFWCNDLGERLVEIWARDASGNTAQCETLVTLYTTSGGCPPGSGSGLPIIQVKALSETVDGVEELEFDVSGTNPNQPFFVNQYCDFVGYCGYFGVPPGSNVAVAPIKDDNPLNGVTSFDKVLISKHIQGVEILNSPYKMIAADVDRNGVVDAVDVEELDKLILGIYTELPNNTSWRFVPKDFVFPDPQNPFASPFPEKVTVLNIQNSLMANFVAIKVGDVNNTAVPNLVVDNQDERALQASPSVATIGQMQPNPTYGAAFLSVSLPVEEMLHLEICDLSGRLLWQNDVRLAKGAHQLEIPATALPGTGLYVWRVRLGGALGSGKLIRY